MTNNCWHAVSLSALLPMQYVPFAISSDTAVTSVPAEAVIVNPQAYTVTTRLLTAPSSTQDCYARLWMYTH